MCILQAEVIVYSLYLTSVIPLQWTVTVTNENDEVPTLKNGIQSSSFYLDVSEVSLIVYGSCVLILSLMSMQPLCFLHSSRCPE